MFTHPCTVRECRQGFLSDLHQNLEEPRNSNKVGGSSERRGHPDRTSVFSNSARVEMTSLLRCPHTLHIGNPEPSVSFLGSHFHVPLGRRALKKQGFLFPLPACSVPCSCLIKYLCICMKRWAQCQFPEPCSKTPKELHCLTCIVRKMIPSILLPHKDAVQIT